VMALGAQRRFGPLRGAYTLYSGYTDSSSPAPAQRFQLMYDYGNHSTVGLSYTLGRELQAGISPLGLTPMEMRDLTLYGSHWLAPQWALTYNVTNYETNSFRRQGLGLGIRHTF
jgi:YaiO family outer membrane protein